MGLFSFFGQGFIFRLIAFVIGLAIHEFGHAYMALLVGDDTAKKQGRVTLNPLAHLDLLGLLMILIVNFGWAKPVMFNPNRIKINRQLGIVLIALAGPLMNALLALCAMLALIGMNNSGSAFWLTSFGGFLVNMSYWLAIVNIALAVFNLIPVPPLDGWKILRYSLPLRWLPRADQFERLGPFLLVLVLILPVGGLIINGAIQSVMGWFGLVL
ncbi:MAG: site-2 protease family protein [Bacilli bacterium]